MFYTLSFFFGFQFNVGICFMLWGWWVLFLYYYLILYSMGLWSIFSEHLRLMNAILIYSRLWEPCSRVKITSSCIWFLDVSTNNEVFGSMNIYIWFRQWGMCFKSVKSYICFCTLKLFFFTYCIHDSAHPQGRYSSLGVQEWNKMKISRIELKKKTHNSINIQLLSEWKYVSNNYAASLQVTQPAMLWLNWFYWCHYLSFGIFVFL
jgi:hypothetical protein